ncbi:uncharacterized protein [Anabrus simplex]|uniref:uncharacterized protein n=1 Tax=Anabrus simplex TaxID=316456 RepID=UPI0035A38E54
MARLIILLAVLGAEYAHAAYKLSGPYEVNVLEFIECQNMTDNRMKYTTKLTKKSKSEKVWSTNFTLPVDMDENSKMVLDADIWGTTGGWNKNAFHHEVRDLCKLMKQDLPDLYEKLIVHFGMNEGCPVKKGTYEVKDYPTKFGIQKKFPELPYGKFRAEMRMFSGDEYVGCIGVTVEVLETA